MYPYQLPNTPNVSTPNTPIPTTVEEMFKRYYNDAVNNTAFNNSGDEQNFDQFYLQYLLNEQNYARTNPAAIASMLQSMGMSRSAALQAASGVQGQTGVPSPQAPSPATIQPITDIVGAASNLFGIASGLANLPFDIRSKKASANLLEQQHNLTGQQASGLNSASMLLQHVANERNKDSQAFADMTPAQVVDAVRKAGTFATAKWFEEFQTNPFAMAAFSEHFGRDYSDASQQYALQKQFEEMLQSRYATDVSRNYNTTLMPLLNSITESEERRARVLADYDEAIVPLRQQLDSGSIEFDSEHLATLRDHIEGFKSIWISEIQAQLNELSLATDKTIFEERKKALFSSYKYQAASFMLESAITDEQMTQWEGMPAEERAGLMSTYIKFVRFNEDAKLDKWFNRGKGVIDTGFRALDMILRFSGEDSPAPSPLPQLHQTETFESYDSKGRLKGFTTRTLDKHQSY